MKKSLILLTLIIFGIRVGLFSLPSFQIDMNDWMAWSSKLVQIGPSNFYSQSYFSDYFPGYLYILWLSGSIFKLLSIPINSQVFEIFIKGITTLFDAGTAYFIFKICSNYAKKWRYIAPLLYLVNPASIFNSSVWGQIDGVFTFFLIFSSYLLLEKKDIFKSSFFSSIGVLIKPQSLALFPIWLIWSFKNFQRKEFLKSLGLGIAIFILLFFPFFPNNPIAGILGLAVTSQDVYKYTSVFAFNFWSLVGWWRPDGTTYILSYKIWGIILFSMSMLLIIIPFFRRKIKSEQYYFAAALSFFSFFILLTRIHERYLFPFLIFILITAAIKKSKSLFTIYIITSLIHFINLWFVYYFYEFVYGKVTLKTSFFYNSYYLINNNYKIFSFLMVLLYLSLLIFYYKSYVKKN